MDAGRPKYKAVIFDLDGTLLDTLEDLAGSVNFTLQKHAGIRREVSQIRTFVGNGIRNLVGRSLPGGQENPVFEQALEDFKAYYKVHSRDNTRPYPHIMDTVRALAARGQTLAIVSNKPDPDTKHLCAEYFGGLFALATGERPGVARKPAPDTVLETMKELGLAREDVVYVGDGETDVQTALNAGVDFIAVTWGFRSEEQLRLVGATKFISDPRELLDLT